MMEERERGWRDGEEMEEGWKDGIMMERWRNVGLMEGWEGGWRDEGETGGRGMMEARREQMEERWRDDDGKEGIPCCVQQQPISNQFHTHTFYTMLRNITSQHVGVGFFGGGGLIPASNIARHRPVCLHSAHLISPYLI